MCKLKYVFLLLSLDEQMILNRVAEAAIDIYGMVCVLSRASRALKNKASSASVEAAMCQVFCDEVCACLSDTVLLLPLHTM